MVQVKDLLPKRTAIAAQGFGHGPGFYIRPAMAAQTPSLQVLRANRTGDAANADDRECAPACLLVGAALAAMNGCAMALSRLKPLPPRPPMVSVGRNCRVRSAHRLLNGGYWMVHGVHPTVRTRRDPLLPVELKNGRPGYRARRRTQPSRPRADPNRNTAGGSGITPIPMAILSLLNASEA